MRQTKTDVILCCLKLCCDVALTVGRVVLQLSDSALLPVSLCVGVHGREVVVAHGRGRLSSSSSVSQSAAALDRRHFTPPTLHLVCVCETVVLPLRPHAG